MDNKERQFYIAVGKHYGYPKCCIIWFVDERMAKFYSGDNMPELTPQQKAVHNSDGFIPCPVCAEKVTSETIHTLIKNRQHPLPYPQTDRKAFNQFKKLL